MKVELFWERGSVPSIMVNTHDIEGSANTRIVLPFPDECAMKTCLLLISAKNSSHNEVMKNLLVVLHLKVGVTCSLGAC